MLRIQASSKTMSSLEIAELTGKQHNDVMRDIRNILNEAEIDRRKFALIYKDSMNREKPCYNLPRRECDLVISGYSVKYRMAIIDRWQELESKQSRQLPQTFSQALMLAAEQAEQIETLTIQAKNDAPKVEFAEAVRRMDGACKIGDFSKSLGIGRNTFFAMLKADKILMLDRMPYQRYIDSGLLDVIEQLPYADSNGKARPAFTTMVTGKGQVWLERKYRQAKDAQ
jgi:Rha family phage regulatory protein